MKVMTFNLRLDVASDGENAWPNRVNHVVEVIKESKVDLIGMQEVLPSMLNDLTHRLDQFDWIGRGREAGSKGEYSPIFFNRNMFELVESGTFWLSETPYVEGSRSWDSHLPRICSWGQFKAKKNPDLEFRVFNTHLDHIGEEARSYGSKLIAQFIKAQNKKKELPSIIMGDFNAYPLSDAIKTMVQAGFENVYSYYNEKIGCTFHQFEGVTEGEPIDYIFTSPDIQIEDVHIDRQSFDGRFPSDHYPIIANVNFSK